MGFVFSLFTLFKPYDVTAYVSDMYWKYTVCVEEEREVSDSGWTLPVEARLYASKKEFYKYGKVFDHYEEVAVQKTRRELSHYETVYSTRDNGNGTFTRTEDQKPVYKTVTYTDYERKPVYRDEPVYKTKYYYYIDKWFEKDTYVTSEHDKNPHFETGYTLEENERDTSKSKTHIICYDNEVTERVSYEEYMDTDIGDGVVITTCKLGLIYETSKFQKED